MPKAPVDTLSIGTPGLPWGPAEIAQWRASRTIKRSYQDEVVAKVMALATQWDVTPYGAVAYDVTYPLYAIRSRQFDSGKASILITGGVHGYETSGVHGALKFVATEMQAFTSHFNFIVLPCISPWSYETINRWNPMAVDPNRSFRAGAQCAEAALAMEFVNGLAIDLLAHLDLHETTDTDETEFRPARLARDGQAPAEPDEIPDGFYLVGNSRQPAHEFQKAIVESVKQVTHIAPPDRQGRLLGLPVVQEGVIQFDVAAQGLCAGFTSARFNTTTEVYPDSPSVTAEQCDDAQVAAIRGALRYLMNPAV